MPSTDTDPSEIATVDKAIDALEDALDAGTNHPSAFRDAVMKATNLLHGILGLPGVGEIEDNNRPSPRGK